MALSDFTLFEDARADLMQGLYDLSGASPIKLALYESARAPTAAESSPTYTVVNEIGDTGTYVAGGIALTTTLVEADGLVTFTATSIPKWLAHVNNTTTAYWGILYNSIGANLAIGFLDLGGPVDMSLGFIEVTWDAAGIFTLVSDTDT